MKALLKFLVLFAAIYSTASMATITKKECEDAGGSWKQVIANKGVCTLDVTAIVLPKDLIPAAVTAQWCKDHGGSIGTDGKCRIGTRNIIVEKNPSNLKQ